MRQHSYLQADLMSGAYCQPFCVTACCTGCELTCECGYDSSWYGTLQASQDSEQATKQKAAAKEAALLETKTRLLLQDKDLLGKVVTDTVANIEKKQARTYEELQAEQMEADEVRISSVHSEMPLCTWLHAHSSHALPPGMLQLCLSLGKQLALPCFRLSSYDMFATLLNSAQYAVLGSLV